MSWSLRCAAALLVALAASASAPSAQTTDSDPTVSTAPDADATETAPRRRPVRRATARPIVRSRPTRRSGGEQPPVSTVSSRLSRAEALALHAARTDAFLRDDAPRWIGIPYRWGGTTRRGIDCSAFVQQFVDDNFAISLPRTTASQRYEGVEIDRSELRAGDLVFFRNRGVRHVGVYLSDGEFIHASSSRGVTISDMTSGYWNGRYWMSRRILPDPPAGLLPRGIVRSDSSAARG